jgi:hypothetical protein
MRQMAMQQISQISLTGKIPASRRVGERLEVLFRVFMSLVEARRVPKFLGWTTWRQAFIYQ